jgi:NAD(P)-dependent dehydrogenase (short-subunit alcohol dehydrogenase family)
MQDRIVLITGAAGALGGAVARAFFAEGASLALVDRAPDRFARVFEDLSGSPRVSFISGINVTDEASVHEMAEQALVRFSRVDVLVNTAGAYKGKAVLDEDPSTWNSLMDLNALSVFLACRAVVPGMRARGRGWVVNIGSPAALAALANGGIYAASKAAVLRLTESLSAELKNEGVNVNAVLPGTMDTPANRAAMPGADPARWVKTDEVADVVIFLASEAARGIRGAAIPVYGRG